MQPLHQHILQVTRSNKGTWRESIASTDLFDIDSKVLDKMQTDMMKDYKVQGTWSIKLWGRLVKASWVVLATIPVYDLDSSYVLYLCMLTTFYLIYTTPGLTPEDTVPDVHHLYQDKTAERARIEKPEVKLYIEVLLYSHRGNWIRLQYRDHRYNAFPKRIRLLSLTLRQIVGVLLFMWSLLILQKKTPLFSPD